MAGLWLRLYTEIRHDRKLRRIPPGQRWLWVVILAIAKESPKPGWLLLSEGVPVTLEDLADEAAIPLDEVESGIGAFIEQRMIESVDGVLHLVNWDKRQFSSDNSTERSRQCRQRKKATLQQRCNDVAATPPETETDTDKDLNNIVGLPSNTGQGPVKAGSDPAPKESIAKLTEAYRSIEGIQPHKRDYSFIGALYKEHSFDKVSSAINKLQMAMATREIKNPLVYLKGILENKDPPKKGVGKNAVNRRNHDEYDEDKFFTTSPGGT